MKKIIIALSATMMISALVACSAADDSTINAPRITTVTDPGAPAAKKTGTAIDKFCSGATLLQSEEHEGDIYAYYYCKQDGNYYGCTSSDCEEIEDDED